MEKKKSWCSDAQRMRRFPCLQDCLLTLTCHLAHSEDETVKHPLPSHSKLSRQRCTGLSSFAHNTASAFDSSALHLHPALCVMPACCVPCHKTCHSFTPSPCSHTSSDGVYHREIKYTTTTLRRFLCFPRICGCSLFLLICSISSKIQCFAVTVRTPFLKRNVLYSISIFSYW